MPSLDISPRGPDLQHSWTAIFDGSADRYDGGSVTITGWTVTAAEMPAAVYCLLTFEPACCGGCLPSDPAICIEVLAVEPVPVDGREMTLRGVFRRLHGDPCGWRYRLDTTTVVHRPTHGSPFALSRRGFVAAASFLCIPVEAVAQASSPTEVTVAQRAAAADFLAARPTIDCHSHAGRILRVRQDEGHAPFTPLAEPMRRGGLATVCLAIVSDSPTHRITPEGRIKAFRDSGTVVGVLEQRCSNPRNGSLSFRLLAFRNLIQPIRLSVRQVVHWSAQRVSASCRWVTPS